MSFEELNLQQCLLFITFQFNYVLIFSEEQARIDENYVNFIRSFFINNLYLYLQLSSQKKYKCHRKYTQFLS